MTSNTTEILELVRYEPFLLGKMAPWLVLLPWRRVGSVLVKSKSLGGACPSNNGVLAKLESLRPLHKLSSEKVRWRVFRGD